MSGRSSRPRNLHEVSCRVSSGKQGFEVALREFLDSFYANSDQREASINEQPRPLDAPRDAYIAAVAEHLARCHHPEVPSWAEHQGLELSKPFFAGKLESLRARLAVESPTAFRRRMLFVSKDALFRPRARPPDA
jgi:hypothetical protein